MLLGVVVVSYVFIEGIIRDMVVFNERLIIFVFSNLISMLECLVEEAYNFSEVSIYMLRIFWEFGRI